MAGTWISNGVLPGHLDEVFALIYFTTPTLCGHATSILQQLSRRGCYIVSSEDTMSLKMCELLLVIGASMA